MNTLDTLTLPIKLEANNSKAMLYVEIAINGTIIVSGEDFPVDIRSLSISKDTSGSFNFWTCHCGIPACAGIVVDIKVEQTDDLVRWINIDLPFLSGVEYVFDKRIYTSTIDRCIQELKNLLRQMKDNAVEVDFYPCPKLTQIEKLL